MSDGRRIQYLAGLAGIAVCILLLLSCSSSFPHRNSCLFEIEYGIVSGENIEFSDSMPGHSGAGALFLKNARESVTVAVNVPQDGSYRLYTGYMLPREYGEKTQNIAVDDGASTAFTFPVSDKFTEIPTGIFRLTAGAHTITMTSSWGWMYADYFRLEPFEIPAVTLKNPKLSNPESSPAAKRVYEYICANFGKNILTGQQESTWNGGPDYEINLLKQWTGKEPAIRGLDYMGGDFSGVNRRAIAWWKRGGLVTICWHTGIRGGAYNESKANVWDFEALLTDGTPENRAMLANWDQAAAALTELRDAGVPVLWRPFHEFDGRWFWWGKGTPEQFVRLWRMMYRRYTEKFGLNNLIWVLGYSGDVSPGWYVGDEYCDIVGSDTYDNSDHAGGWRKLAFEKIGNKPFTFHECGVLPPFEDFGRDQCMWSWFLIWHTEWIRRNSPEALRTFYNHDGVITLDELPDFTRGQ